jgi:ferredoxin
VSETTQVHGPVRSQRNGVTIEVDRQLCYGFGDCVDSAPGVFELDGEDVSIVVDAEAADLDTLMMAAQDCPVDAIIICDAETGEQVYP